MHLIETYYNDILTVQPCSSRVEIQPIAAPGQLGASLRSHQYRSDPRCLEIAHKSVEPFLSSPHQQIDGPFDQTLKKRKQISNLLLIWRVAYHGMHMMTEICPGK